MSTLVPLLKSYFLYLKELGYQSLPLKPFLKNLLALKTEPPTSQGIEELKEKISKCEACRLSQTRKTPIWGEGSLEAKIFVVLDYPRKEEDLQGLVIAGPYREFLFRILQPLSQNREKDLFLTLAVKCKPKGYSPPEDTEIEACKNHLLAQIRLIKPKIILCFGLSPAKLFLGTEKKLTLQEIRKLNFNFAGIPVFFTHHPEDISRNTQIRRIIWEDLNRVKEWLKKLN